MRSKLIKILEIIRTSFWFWPTLMILASIAIALIAIWLDSTQGEKFPKMLSGLFSGGPGSARTVLNLLASSMITVAGVVFSITIVALALASQQFGPRLLRNFMKDLGNQLVLGTFISTFTYCIVILPTIHETDQSVFIPYFSLSFGLLFALFNIFVLIYYIHHIASFIQVGTVIEKVSQELFSSIDRVLPHPLKSGEEETQSDVVNFAVEHDLSQKVSLCSQKRGYIQAIDYEGLLGLAQENGLSFYLNKKSGDYIFEKNCLLKTKASFEEGKESLETKVNACFVVGGIRTDAQDVEYSVSELVEVAIRALSPGINDPRTAINCLDRLGEAIAIILQRKIPSPHFLDSDKQVRLIVQPIKLSSIIDEAFNEIRQYGRESVAVQFRLLEILKETKSFAIRAEDKAVLNRHAAMVYRSCQKYIIDPEDLAQAKQRYENYEKSEGNISG